MKDINLNNILNAVYTIVLILGGIPLSIRAWKCLLRRRRRIDAVDNDIITFEDNQDETNVQDVGVFDQTRYYLGQDTNDLGKGRLVQAIIREYVSKNPDVTYEELLKVFPASLRVHIGSIAAFTPYFLSVGVSAR